MTYPPDKLAPCGTAAGARRHYRRGEKPCPTCAQASRRDRNERTGYGPGRGDFDPRPIRNGIPEPVAYTWRGRRYPWAEAVNVRMEAVHGRPDEHDLDDLGYLLDSGYARAVSA